MSWSKRARVIAVVLALVALAITYIFVPGMVGTIRGLFVGLGEDTSAASRTNSYAVALEMAGRTLYVGRGFGTFLPEYRILDNQYLGLLIEIGVLGLLAFLGMIAAGLVCSLLAKRRLKDPLLSNLSYAIFASLTAGSVTFAFFDALTFPMAAVFMFFLLGLSGAVWRISQQPEPLV
jgi:O-antigen ligase